MEFTDFIQKHKQIKQSVRTYIMIFMKSGQEHYLDYAVRDLKQLFELHKEFKELSGQCPHTELLKEHNKESETQAKILELKMELEKAEEWIDQATDTVPAKINGRVVWRKGA